MYVSYKPPNTCHSLNHICSISRNETKKCLSFKFYTVGREMRQGSKVWKRKLEVPFHLRTHKSASTANTRRRPLCLINDMQPVTMDRLTVLSNSFSRMCPPSLSALNAHVNTKPKPKSMLGLMLRRCGCSIHPDSLITLHCETQVSQIDRGPGLLKDRS